MQSEILARPQSPQKAGKFFSSTLGANNAEESVLAGLRELEHLVDTLVASWHSSPHIVQNRSQHRMGFLHPIVIQPVDEQTHKLAEEPRLVSGRDISQEGISFSHQKPIPQKLIQVTFNPADDQPVSVIVELTWCRFSREGHYQSGGKFRKTESHQLSKSIDWESLPSA